jgi:hypothetical protein
MKLNKHDLNWCVRKLPFSVRKLLKEQPVAVGGGYIRAHIAREKVNDIDLFCDSEKLAMKCALILTDGNEKRIYKTENALTIKGIRPTVQFITRWVFPNPTDIIESFDWTICQAVFWWDRSRWESHCSESFYPDLAAKRLIYTFPTRKEAPGGSILRVLKYYQRDYRITLDSYAGVIARLCAGVRQISENIDEEYLKKLLKGLLEEVDPQIDPDHILAIHEFDEEEEDV